jgi:hypothetical protein
MAEKWWEKLLDFGSNVEQKYGKSLRHEESGNWMKVPRRRLFGSRRKKTSTN